MSINRMEGTCFKLQIHNDPLIIFFYIFDMIEYMPLALK